MAKWHRQSRANLLPVRKRLTRVFAIVQGGGLEAGVVEGREGSRRSGHRQSGSHLPVHKQLSHELLQRGSVALHQSAHLGPDVKGRVQTPLTERPLVGERGGGSSGQLL